MPKFMWTGSYSVEGTKGVIAHGGTARREAVEKLASSVGGRMEAFYFCVGSDDHVAIFDVPDNETAASIALTVGASGGVRGHLTLLLSPEQVDAAAKLSPTYMPPNP